MKQNTGPYSINELIRLTKGLRYLRYAPRDRNEPATLNGLVEFSTTASTESATSDIRNLTKLFERCRIVTIQLGPTRLRVELFPRNDQELVEADFSEAKIAEDKIIEICKKFEGKMSTPSEELMNHCFDPDQYR